METLRRGSNMGQMTDTELETRHYQEFCNWYRDYVRQMSNTNFTEAQMSFLHLFFCANG
jgi:hypothetical protein